MGLLSWSIVAGTNARMGALANIGVSIAGAVAGGLIFNAFGSGVAFVGAVVILAVARLVFGI